MRASLVRPREATRGGLDLRKGAPQGARRLSLRRPPRHPNARRSAFQTSCGCCRVGRDVTVRYAPRPPGRPSQRVGKAMSVDVLKRARRSDAAILNLNRGRRDGRAETRELQEPDRRDIARIRDQDLSSNGFGKKAAEVAAPRKTPINRDPCARRDRVERVDQFRGPEGDPLDHRAAEICARSRRDSFRSRDRAPTGPSEGIRARTARART